MTRTAGGDATMHPRPEVATYLDTYQAVPSRLWRDARDWYVATFWQVNHLAAQRHLMTEAEFFAMLADERITKHVAVDPGGRIIGMSAVTNDLHAWSLISPPYFERRWPAEVEARLLWYVGFVGAHPEAPRNTFTALLAATSMPARIAGGIVCMDFCGFNVDERRLPTVSGLVMRRIDKSTRTELVDRQEFWAFHFDGEQGA